MLKKHPHIFAGIFTGIVFYFVLVYVLGYTTALTFPDWYRSFMVEYKALGMAFWNLGTNVLAIILISCPLGAVLSKVIDKGYAVAGGIAVAISMVLTLADSIDDSAFLQTVRTTLLPSHWSAVPNYLAWYVSLPFVTWYLGRRNNAT